MIRLFGIQSSYLEWKQLIDLYFSVWYITRRIPWKRWHSLKSLILGLKAPEERIHQQKEIFFIAFNLLIIIYEGLDDKKQKNLSCKPLTWFWHHLLKLQYFYLTILLISCVLLPHTSNWVWQEILESNNFVKLQE